MALISIGGPRRLTALLRELTWLTRSRADAAPPTPPARRHYPPRREPVIESAAMRREMFRL